MTKAPISLQELRRRIYRKAKSDKTHRFWGIFVHITKPETQRSPHRALAEVRYYIRWRNGSKMEWQRCHSSANAEPG